MVSNVHNVQFTDNRREFSPGYDEEDNKVYIYHFIRNGTIHNILIRDIIWIGEAVQIYVSDPRENWIDLVDDNMLDDKGNFLPIT